MAINRQKISQMTPKGSDLDATDLLEVSVDTGSGYETRSITGAEVFGGVSGTYVPYTGATQDVDLGEFELKAGQLTLDTSPTGTAAVGTTRWNNTLGSSETTLKGGSVILKNGVDLVARVVNKVTPNATLTKAAYQAVRVTGAQGQRLAVAYAQANNDNNSADTIGLVTETIATNQEGFIITVGQLEEINTTGSLQGESWSDGDVLYLSSVTPGAITNIKPTAATAHLVVIGYVEYAHVNHGKIYVKIMNGWELDELHNVYINTGTLANNDALIYESSTQLWKNKTIATALGYTPLKDIVEDTTPQLGGDLDVNGFKITSDSDQDVIINPNGTGITKIESNLNLRDTAGSTALQVNLYEGFSNGTNYIGIKAADTLSGNTTYTLPTADGTSGQVLQTNGSGTLSWATAGGISILDQTNGSPSIGTTNTISKSIALPSVPTTLKFLASTFRTSGTNLQFTTRVYLSDVNNNIGGTAVQIATITSFNTASNYTRIARNGFDIISGNIIGMNGTVNNASDDVSQTQARLNSAIPTGTPLYLIFTVQCNSALDSVRVEGVQISSF
jgi:hypothetical protein